MVNKKATPYNNWKRVKILTILSKQELTMTELSEMFGISTKSIYNHLKTLSKKGLIIKLEPDTSKPGHPVKYKASKKAQPIPQKLIDFAEFMFNFEKSQKGKQRDKK